MAIAVCSSSEIPPGDRKSFEVDGREVTVLNVDGEFYAVRSYCPHMAGPLGRGATSRADDGSLTISCPFHNWTFDLADGRAVSPLSARAQTYDVEVVYDVSVEDGEVVLHL